MLIQWFDSIAYILMIIGLWRIAKQQLEGWVLQAGGSLLMIIFGLYYHHFGIWIGNIIFLLISISGYFGALKSSIKK